MGLRATWNTDKRDATVKVRQAASESVRDARSADVLEVVQYDEREALRRSFSDAAPAKAVALSCRPARCGANAEL